MKKGFTLVELAIVLVIIGLLIGGVLAGQELIKQAKLNKVISQLTELKRAVTTFQSKYGQLPGDFNKATRIWGAVVGSCDNVAGTGTQTCDGDGNGIMTYENSGYESWRAWEQLSNAELVAGNYTGIQTLPACSIGRCAEAGVNVPAGTIENSIWIFTYFDRIGKDKSRNGFGFGSPVNDGTSNGGIGWPGRWHHGILSPEDAYSIDTKLDDGMPFKGTVTELGGTTYTPGCTSSESSSTTTATYVLTNIDRKCTLMFDY